MSTIPPEESIRYILGAVGPLAGIISDEEITDALLVYPTDWRLAAAYVADSLASRAINDPESFGLTGVLTVSWGDRAAAWSRLSAQLRTQVAEDSVNNGSIGAIQVTRLRREFLNAEPAEYSQARRDRGRLNYGYDE
jgi:hypothetical protein